MPRIAPERSDDDVTYIEIRKGKSWAYSKFPHPLVTLDYDKDDALIGISLVGLQNAKAYYSEV